MRHELVRGVSAVLLVLLGGPGCLTVGAWRATGNAAPEAPRIERVERIVIQADGDLARCAIRLAVDDEPGTVFAHHALAAVASGTDDGRLPCVVLVGNRALDASTWGLRVGRDVSVPTSDGGLAEDDVPLDADLARRAVVVSFAPPHGSVSSLPCELSFPPPGGRPVDADGAIDWSQDRRATLVVEAPPPEEVPFSRRLSFGLLAPFTLAVDLALGPWELGALVEVLVSGRRTLDTIGDRWR